MIAGGRGGYCLEQNMLFRAGVAGPGVHGDEPHCSHHSGSGAGRSGLRLFIVVLRVDLPEGPFLADVGYGAPDPDRFGTAVRPAEP